MTPAGEGRFTATIDERWMLAVLPQGGAVAALATFAMEAVLAHPEQALRSLNCVFAGQVAAGPVEIEVGVIRAGRTMSQLTATVRNPGNAAGLTALAVFGAPRRGFEFTEEVFPDAPDPEGLRSFRDPIPDGVDFEFDHGPMPFWERSLECRPVDRRPPWEPFEPGPAETVLWYRLDDPPVLDDGTMHPASMLVIGDTMPGAVDQKLGPDVGPWYGPSADLTVHVFGRPHAGWVLARNRARHAGDGYASVEMELWDPVDRRLVAHSSQMMFFTVLS